MTSKHHFSLLVACAFVMNGCGGGGQNAQSPIQQGGSGPTSAGQLSGDQLDAAEKQKQELAAQMNRGIKKEEFTLTMLADDPTVAQMEAVNIDVISATLGEAERLEAMGPVKYRDSRQTGANTRSHVFRKGGRFVLQVPTIPATDTLLLWAELPAPANGNDTRFLVVPLALDKSDPAIGPVANPITVRLTANGWSRVN